MPLLETNSVILFQGDSITDGGRWKGDDQNHIYGQDYGYIVAGRIGVDYPERNLTFVNRGVSGNRVPDLAARWKEDALDLKPNVLSILVGINDSRNRDSDGPAQFEAAYDRLIVDTQTALPNTQIVLGDPFALRVGSHVEGFDQWRAHIQLYQDAVKRLARKYRLPIVEYQRLFNDACKRAPASHWSWDGIHPTPAGHMLMAEEWIRVVGSLPKPAAKS